MLFWLVPSSTLHLMSRLRSLSRACSCAARIRVSVQSFRSALSGHWLDFMMSATSSVWQWYISWRDFHNILSSSSLPSVLCRLSHSRRSSPRVPSSWCIPGRSFFWPGSWLHLIFWWPVQHRYWWLESYLCCSLCGSQLASGILRYLQLSHVSVILPFQNFTPSVLLPFSLSLLPCHLSSLNDIPVSLL